MRRGRVSDTLKMKHTPLLAGHIAPVAWRIISTDSFTPRALIELFSIHFPIMVIPILFLTNSEKKSQQYLLLQNWDPIQQSIPAQNRSALIQKMYDLKTTRLLDWWNTLSILSFTGKIHDEKSDRTIRLMCNLLRIIPWPVRVCTRAEAGWNRLFCRRGKRELWKRAC